MREMRISVHEQSQAWKNLALGYGRTRVRSLVGSLD